MKFTISFLLVLAAFANVSYSMSIVNNNNHNEEDGELGMFLQMVLTDPEFLTLSQHEQYKILNALYTIIINSMKIRNTKSVLKEQGIQDVLKRNF